jgi:hypothetical protein
MQTPTASMRNGDYLFQVTFRSVGLAWHRQRLASPLRRWECCKLADRTLGYPAWAQSTAAEVTAGVIVDGDFAHCGVGWSKCN